MLSFKNYKTFLNEKNVWMMFEGDIQIIKNTKVKISRQIDKKSADGYGENEIILGKLVLITMKKNSHINRFVHGFFLKIQYI